LRLGQLFGRIFGQILRRVPMSRFLYCFAFVLIASSALAQTAHEHDACARDVTRFCRAHMNEGDQVVLSCLQQNRQRLSRACEKVLVEHGQ
jgi:Cysteine rich repeat